MDGFCVAPFVEGCGTGAGLIIAIGAQNAFVLKQGILKNYVLVTVLICAFIDALLISIGVGGFGAILTTNTLLLAIARWGGALNMFHKILNKTTLFLAALLLGDTFMTSGWTMDTAEKVHSKKGHSKKVKHKTAMTMRDLEDALNNIPQENSQSKGASIPITEVKESKDFFKDTERPPKSGDLVLLNVDHGLLQSYTYIPETIKRSLYVAHTRFLENVNKKNSNDYYEFTESPRRFSEFPGLPAQLDILSKSGVYIIPVTDKRDNGMSDVHGTPCERSDTEEKFVELRYYWDSWKKLQALDVNLPDMPSPYDGDKLHLYIQKNIVEQPWIIRLQDDSNPLHGIYKYRNGIVYGESGKKRHNSAAIVGLMRRLKEQGAALPSAIYFVDDRKNIKQVAEDLKNTNLGVPVYLLAYKKPKSFTTPEKLKDFYIYKLGSVENFNKYNSQFEEAFKEQND